MTEETLVTKAKTALFQRNVAVAGVGVFGIISVLLSVSLARLDSKIVIVPLTGGQPMEVSDSKVSAAYLEAITRDVTTTFLNTTPQSEDYVRRVLVDFACPEFHGSLVQQISDRWREIKRFQLTTVFYPQSISFGDNDLSTRVRGRLDTYVNQDRTSTKTKWFELTFKNNASKICLSGFYEVDKSGTRVENEQPIETSKQR